MPDDVKIDVKATVKLPFTARLVGFVQGKTTGWLLGFFTLGNAFHYYHRLDATYISFMTTFMAIALGHSIKEDYFGSKNGQ